MKYFGSIPSYKTRNVNYNLTRVETLSSFARDPTASNEISVTEKILKGQTSSNTPHCPKYMWLELSFKFAFIARKILQHNLPAAVNNASLPSQDSDRLVTAMALPSGRSIDSIYWDQIVESRMQIGKLALALFPFVSTLTNDRISSIRPSQSLQHSYTKTPHRQSDLRTLATFNSSMKHLLLYQSENFSRPW